MKAIITFHSIDNDSTVLSFSPRLFSQMVDSLIAQEIPVLTLDELLGAGCSRGVALTFDDGMASLFGSALPVLRDHSIPAHLFLAASAVAGTNRWPGQPNSAPECKMLNWDQLHALNEAGVCMEGHTYSHIDLRDVGDAAISDEFERCDAIIEKEFGRRPSYFAYPYGFYNRHVRGLAGARYKACVTTKLDYLSEDNDRAALPRLDSYYLQNAFFAKDLFSLKTRKYIAARAVLRKMRGRFWNKSHA